MNKNEEKVIEVVRRLAINFPNMIVVPGFDHLEGDFGIDVMAYPKDKPGELLTDEFHAFGRELCKTANELPFVAGVYYPTRSNFFPDTFTVVMYTEGQANSRSEEEKAEFKTFIGTMADLTRQLQKKERQVLLHVAKKLNLRNWEGKLRQE